MNGRRLTSRVEALKTASGFGRDAIKGIVKEAVREEMAERERMSPSRPRSGGTSVRRAVLLLGAGALVGALVARKMPPRTEEIPVTIRSRAPTEREERERGDDDRAMSEPEAPEPEGEPEIEEGAAD